MGHLPAVLLAPPIVRLDRDIIMECKIESHLSMTSCHVHDPTSRHVHGGHITNAKDSTPDCSCKRLESEGRALLISQSGVCRCSPFHCCI